MNTIRRAILVAFIGAILWECSFPIQEQLEHTRLFSPWYDIVDALPLTIIIVTVAAVAWVLAGARKAQ